MDEMAACSVQGGKRCSLEQRLHDAEHVHKELL